MRSAKQRPGQTKSENQNLFTETSYPSTAVWFPPINTHKPRLSQSSLSKLKDKIAVININLCEAEVVPFTITHALRGAFVKSKQYTPVYLMQNIQ